MVEVMRLENSPLPDVVRVFELAPLALAPAVFLAAGLVCLARRWRSHRDAGTAERCWSLPAYTGLRLPAEPSRPSRPPAAPGRTDGLSTGLDTRLGRRPE